jgi:hypothetical protein
MKTRKRRPFNAGDHMGRFDYIIWGENLKVSN